MREKREDKKEYRSISFPLELMEAIGMIIKKTGYKSNADWATEKLRIAVKEELKKPQYDVIRKRLQSLGYGA